MSLPDVERLDAVLIVGGFPRKDQPIFNHRLRKAVLAGAKVMVINPVDFSFNYELADKCIESPANIVSELAAVLKAAIGRASRTSTTAGLLKAIRPKQRHKKHRSSACRGRQGSRIHRQPGCLPSATVLAAIPVRDSGATGSRHFRLS